jgi:vacuolar-type H+-ATPase subunit H
MPEEINESKEPLVLLGSFPLDDASGAEEEKIDSLWRQMMVYKAFEQDLSESRARRAEAEAVRERTEQEAYRAALAHSHQMRAESERELSEAREQRQQASKANQEAQEALANAKETVAKARKEHDQLIEDARKEAQEITDKARASAQREVTELRRQALKEVKGVLGRVENMRAAANEELETQRILSSVAKLKATTKWDLSDQDGQPEATATQSEAIRESAPAANSNADTGDSSPKSSARKQSSSDKS